MSDDTLKRFKKIVDLLHKLGNDEISDEFVKYWDAERREREELISWIEKQQKFNEKNYLKFERTETRLHDIDIETHNLVNDASSEIVKAITPFFNQLPNVTKAVMNSPRLAGLLLLLFGHKWIYYVTHIDLNKIIEEATHKKPNSEGVKQ